MKKSVEIKFNQYTTAFDWQRAMKARTFAEFDDSVTTPLHGFSGNNGYYDRCSSKDYLKKIRRTTLIINSLDDTFMTPEIILDQDQLSDCVTLEASEHGDHVEFISGDIPWQLEYYLPKRITNFLASKITETRESIHNISYI
jgi:predicted alpha/beta-fold hydrolase